jgi:hypothetical protein
MTSEEHINNVTELVDRLHFSPIDLHGSGSFLFLNTDSKLGSIFGVTNTLSDISPVLSDEFDEQQ